MCEHGDTVPVRVKAGHAACKDCHGKGWNGMPAILCETCKGTGRCQGGKVRRELHEDFIDPAPATEHFYCATCGREVTEAALEVVSDAAT